MATNKNFEVKNGLTIAGTERISSAGAFTGSLASATTAATQTAADSSTKIATTAYTDAAITAVIGGAPGTLDTLNELAAAINDDASYASTLTSALSTKLPLSGGTMTGELINTSTAGITSNSTSHSYLTANSSATTTASWIQHKQGGTGRWLAGVEGSETDYQLYAGGSTRLRVTAAGAVTIPGTLGITGAATFNSSVNLGSIGTSTSTATPVELNLGSTYADAAGSAAKAKLKVYEDSVGYVYGLGVSSGTFESHLSYPTGKYDWYIGTDKKMSITHDGNIDLGTNNTGSLRVPNGTDAQRPTGANGMIRYNTSSSKLEGYIDSGWKPVSAGIDSLTTISGLDLWMDVTAGISSTTIADLSGNSRTGTASSTTNKGTVGSNTYMLCNSNNYIEYANGKIPNYSADVTYFFVSTNVPSLAGHQTYLGQASGSTGYQIIRTGSNVNTWQFYFTSQGNVNLIPTNTGHNVNSTVGNSTQIHTFSFGTQANGNLTVYKRTGGTNTSDVFPNNSFPGGNAEHQWVANSNATRLGNSSWANEFFAGGIFAWGIIDHPITTTELGVIYDYYADKGLGT
jgi:hypothetical protein